MTTVINELSEAEAKDALARIANIVFPGDDPDAEWSNDEIEAVAEVIERLGLKPAPWPQGKFKILGKLDVTAEVYIENGVIHIPEIFVNERPEWDVTPGAIAQLADDPIDADSITEQQVSLIDAALTSAFSDSGISFEWDTEQPIADLLG
jgi:hypothetical protein